MVRLQSFLLTFVLLICLEGGRMVAFYFPPSNGFRGEFFLHGIETLKKIKVIRCIDSLPFYKLAQTHFTT